jgi:hypothetical protein
MRRPAILIILLWCLVTPFTVSGGDAEQDLAPASPTSVDEAGPLSSDEKVSFNKSSRKYHCQTCTWAKKCTENCVTVTRAEAIKRGGVACKVCDGSCR